MASTLRMQIEPPSPPRHFVDDEPTLVDVVPFFARGSEVTLEAIAQDDEPPTVRAPKTSTVPDSALRERR